jgi:hypothetical protein
VPAARHVGLRRHLQHRLGDGAEDGATAGFRQQVGPWPSLLSQRRLGQSGVAVRTSTRTARSDGPPKPYTPGGTVLCTTAADATQAGILSLLNEDASVTIFSGKGGE